MSNTIGRGNHLLRRLDSREIPVAPHEVRAFIVARDEKARLRHTLAYHRALGVDRFIVIDNRSSDGTTEFLASQPDTHVYLADGDYCRARLGIDWLEPLLDVHGTNQWCLVLDADEQLVYEGSESRPVSHLCQSLESVGVNCLVTMFLDMYSSKAILRNKVRRWRSLLRSNPLFDASGYHDWTPPESAVPRIYGGPRARLFWPDRDLEAIARLAESITDRAFDSASYLARHPDVARAVADGVIRSARDHFDRYGRAEPRQVPIRSVPEWEEEAYLTANDDVREAIEDGRIASGLEHYVRFGRYEGRLLTRDWPPCLTQVPLVRWTSSTRYEVGRHGLSGAKWRHPRAVGGALLHFKLTSGLLAQSQASRPERPEDRAGWPNENARYEEALRSRPALAATSPISTPYTRSAQLVSLGLILPTSGL